MRELGDWVVVMEWPDGVDDGGPGRLVIEPVGEMPVGGLSSTVLRKINFQEAVERFRVQIAASERRSGDAEAMKAFERDQLRSALSNGITDEYLAVLALEYVRASGRGQAKINDYLAEMIDKPVGTLRGHLSEARSRELLSSSPGRKGGKLSATAEALVQPYTLAWLDQLDTVSKSSAAGKPN